MAGNSFDLRPIAPPGDRVSFGNSNSDVPVMKSAQDCQAKHAAFSLDLARNRRILSTPSADAPQRRSSAAAQHADAIVVFGDWLTVNNAPRVTALAAKHRLPAIYVFRLFATNGGLISYGPDLADTFLRLGGYVDKILKGAKPSDLPVELPTRFDLVINRKTANGLGLTVPPSLLALADEVIE